MIRLTRFAGARASAFTESVADTRDLLAQAGGDHLSNKSNGSRDRLVVSVGVP
jgi:hypothetical protein